MRHGDPDERPYYRTGDTQPTRTRGIFRLIVAGGVAVIFAGALWFAYTKMHGAGGPGGVPLIRADQSPTKIKPEQSAGDEGKSVFNTDENAAGKSEQLLPPPEQPMAKPQPAPSPPPAADIPPTASVPATPAPAPVPAPLPAKPAPAPQPAKPAPTPTAAPAIAAPGAAGAFRVQVAATKDEASAHSEWTRLQNAHLDLLESLSITVVRADLGDKGVFYRVQAGPIADHAQAEKLCGQLKAVSVGCMVVKSQ